MKIKLWMTQNPQVDTYCFSRSMPEFDKRHEMWFSGDADGYSDIVLRCRESEITKHLRFKKSGADAIRLVELDITINGVEEAGK